MSKDTQSKEKKSALQQLNDFYDRYSGIFKLIIMVMPLIFASYKYLDSYIDVPDRMDRFESKMRRDSTQYTNKFKRDSTWIMDKFRKLDSTNRQLRAWSDTDAVHLYKLEKHIFGSSTIK